MANIWMPGGGGPNLSGIDAEPKHVLANKKIVDKYGNPLVGTMPDRGAVSQSLAINGTYTIPEGYHNGQGKVTQGITTMAAQTINPTASKQTVQCANKYMNGNVDVNGVSNLTEANVKRNQNVGGTVGSCDYTDTFNAKIVNDVLITKKATSYQDLVGYTMNTNDSMMTIFEDLSGNFYPNYESWHYLVKVDDYHSYAEVRIGRLQNAEFYLENTPYIDNVGSPQNSGLVKFSIYQITAGKVRIKAICYHPNHKTYYPRVTIFLRMAGTASVPSLT